MLGNRVHLIQLYNALMERRNLYEKSNEVYDLLLLNSGVVQVLLNLLMQ